MGGFPYRSENLLAEEFCSALESAESPWGEVAFIREFGYVRGRADVVALDSEGNVLAFELKLEKWFEALHQAYRNTCFAHRSYVVLPEPTARRAERHPHEFVRRSVGLCYLKDGDVVVSFQALREPPLQPWLSSAAASEVSVGSRDGV